MGEHEEDLYDKAYEPPTLEDLGDLWRLTQATTTFGDEDGASKLQAFHHTSQDL